MHSNVLLVDDYKEKVYKEKLLCTAIGFIGKRAQRWLERETGTDKYNIIDVSNANRFTA